MFLRGREKPDFIAILKYLPPEQGGRENFVYSKYRPIIEFPGFERMAGCEQRFIGKDLIYPGETVQAQISILSDEYFKGKLYVGQSFRFFEIPNKTLGTGEIIEIINEDLEKK